MMRADRRQFRGGVAMVLVISAVAIATVLGWAMLSGAVLQTRARANASRSASAEYLAESGINLAFYYLQNPDQAPALNSSGYWSGTTSALSIGSGTVQVSVVQDSSDKWTYEVTSTGSISSTTGTSITRTSYARVYVRNEYQVKYAAGFAGGTSVVSGVTINGSAICNGTFNLKTGSFMSNGSITAQSVTLGLGESLPSGGFKTIASYQVPAPTTGDLNTYQTYSYNGSTYSADAITTSSLVGSSGVTTLGATATNPAGIQYCSGNLTLGDNVTINGTLVVGGNLIVSGANIVVTPATNYPAVIVLGSFQMNQTLKSMTINGVCYIGSTLKSSGIVVMPGTSSTLTINGGLLSGNASGGISSTYNATTTVIYNSSLAKAPDLSSSGRSPTGINVLRWGPVVPAPY